MLQSQKMKCLVLSRYPHSDPHIKVIRRLGSFHMKTVVKNSIAHRRAILLKTIMSTRNPDPKFRAIP